MKQRGIILCAALLLISLPCAAVDIVPERSLFVDRTMADEVFTTLSLDLLNGGTVLRTRSLLSTVPGESFVTFTVNPAAMTVTGMRLSSVFKTPQGVVRHPFSFDFLVPVVVAASEPVRVKIRITESGSVKRVLVLNAAEILPVVSLAVQGAPNLSLNGMTTAVTVGFVNKIPVKVELSRDGQATFATWPTDSFFTLAADGRTLTGSWCISNECWGGVAGSHVLNLVATYADGSIARASVNLNVAP